MRKVRRAPLVVYTVGLATILLQLLLTLSTRFGSNVNREVTRQIGTGNSHVGYTDAEYIVNYMFWGESGYDADHTSFKNNHGGVLVFVRQESHEANCRRIREYHHILHTDLKDTNGDGSLDLFTPWHICWNNAGN